MNKLTLAVPLFDEQARRFDPKKWPGPVFALRAEAAAPSPPPVAIGEASVTVNVTMSYAIQ